MKSDQVPDDFIVIFSAHGVSQAVRMEADKRGLKVFDATCPLVTKVHLEVTKYSREGRECILIGHHGHPEVEGTMGQYDTANGGSIYLVEDEDDVAQLQVRNPESLAFVTQCMFVTVTGNHCPFTIVQASYCRLRKAVSQLDLMITRR
ncbi:4-hydroxy-3-methylbut-2-enyl diphosphate reductase [Stutzerimonas stutzeri]